MAHAGSNIYLKKKRKILVENFFVFFLFKKRKKLCLFFVQVRCKFSFYSEMRFFYGTDNDCSLDGFCSIAIHKPVSVCEK